MTTWRSDAHGAVQRPTRNTAARRWRRGAAMAVALAAVATVAPLTAQLAGRGRAEAAPLDCLAPSDPCTSSIPHYFGPYPNYTNSPQVTTNAVVTVAPPADPAGVPAEATATVNPVDGSISAITVTVPGSGYTSAPAITIDAPGAHQSPFTPATATAVLATGALQSIAVDTAGFGYTAPVVTVDAGDGTATATAVVSGGVDSLTLVDGGTGYVNHPVVEFSMPDLPDGVQATGVAQMDATGAISSVDVLDAGSGYTTAPTVRILDGTAENQLGATVRATIGVSRIDLVDPGAGYRTAPAVTITDATGTGADATATATVAAAGSVVDVQITNKGQGYLTPGIKKFVDTLPGLGQAGANNLGEYISVAQPDTTTYPGTDYYEIAVVQYRHRFHSSLPSTLVRGYVQLSTPVVPGKHVALSNAGLDPNAAPTPVTLNGQQVYAVDAPSYLGPTIVASKNRPVRILFRNLLPTGSEGDLFLPVDTTLMGAGSGPGDYQDPNTIYTGQMMLDANGNVMDMTHDQGSVFDDVRNPMCQNSPKPAGCFTENRAELHLHGGITPWISDGTPHQWVTPAGESTIYPKGVSVSNVPDMPDPGPGAETFFYTNQQSARLMFYHDHAWGITRLNVYAGEAAGYMITDDTEQRLFGTGGAFADLGLGTPLIIQDKTFVPSADQIAATDPTWNTAKWGGEGSLWTPHVYMPAQNPSAPGGMSGFGRWMYGAWFWPPATGTKYGPIDNPYYDPTCDPNTAVDNFCEPQMIPGTPNVSVGMEAFNDTPVVNGVAYPTTTVDPKAYRFRLLNAANDRFWNLSWYVADPTTGTLSEVALNTAEVAAAQTDPVVFPTPDTSKSPAGPNWVQIGSEGGFLPTPVVIPAQPTTWITDPTRFDVGNVDQHSLLLAPAERADVIVDFSQFRGKTLILYNDAPAAFPARVSSYDYYTGGPDLSPVGAPSTLPGYGPNTRTVMQVKVSAKTPAAAFDKPGTNADRLGSLMTAFAHHTDGSGVFESGQHAPIVGQAAYNEALGTSFVSAGWCNSPTKPTDKCDGFARIQEQGGEQFKFDTVDPAAMASTSVAAASDGVDVSTLTGAAGSTLAVDPTAVGFGKAGKLTVETSAGTANLSYQGSTITKNAAGTVTSYVFDKVKLVSGSGVVATGGFVHGPQGQLAVPLEPKGIHDETNSATFDEYGRMTANLGLEAPGATPLTQNIILYPYTNPATEIIDATKLPDGISATPISVADDGTQIWKFTHNGVDTHPIHFHLYDVQVINRVTWDNIVMPPDPNELGWKDTVRISPLEDTIVAVRAIIPKLPFAIPDSRRPLNPMMPIGAKGDQPGPNGNQAGFNNTDANGNPINPIVNTVQNFFWEYVLHCHILSHEEMDMMRPVNVKVDWSVPQTPVVSAGTDGDTLQWTDGSPLLTMLDAKGVTQLDLANIDMQHSEIGFVVERAEQPLDGSEPVWSEVGRAVANATTWTDTTADPSMAYLYRVSAWNEAGRATSAELPVAAAAPVPTFGTTTSLASSANPATVGEPVTLTATVSTAAAVEPTGSVTFTVDGTDQTVDLVGGTASITTSALAAGDHVVTAQYHGTPSGAAVRLTKSSDSLSQSVVKIATTTALVASAASIDLGSDITLTATVAPADATGVVTFALDAGMPTATVRTATVVGGVATWTGPLTVGTHTATAAYGGDPTYSASSGNTVSVDVVPVATSVTLTSNRNPANVGQTVTFTALVVESVSAVPVPAGLVTFTLTRPDGTAETSTVAVDTNGRAAFTPNALGQGTYSVSAAFNATSPWAAATSNTVTQVVNRVPTAVALRASANPSVTGQPVTFTATLSTSNAGGTITFVLDNARFIAVPVDANGVARVVISSFTVGAHSVRAVYGGTAVFAPSTSTTLAQTVNRANTSVSVAVSAPTAIPGRTTKVTFTATVTANSPGSGVANGMVRFWIDGVVVGDVLLNTAGKASFARSSWTVGGHSVWAQYLGSTRYNASSRTSRSFRIY